MAEGNGADVGSMYGLLVDIAKKVSQQEAVLEQHGAILERISALLGETRLELTSTKLDIASVKADVADLRRTVETYHSSVVGQGILASELEARVGRVEQHLDLPPFVHG